MVEVKHANFAAAAIPSSSETGMLDKLGKPDDLRYKEKDRSAELEQLTATMQEMLPRMRALSLQAQVERAARPAFVMQKASKASHGGVTAEARESLASGDKKSRSAQARPTAALTTLTERAFEAGAERASSPAHVDPGGVMRIEQEGAVAAALLDSRTTTERKQLVDAGDKTATAVELSVSGPHFKENQTGPVPERYALPQMRRAQEAPAYVSSASADSIPVNGWTYNFRSWGIQHAVRISTHPGMRAEADAPLSLSLSPSSHLVEQRLQSHAGEQGSALPWVVHEHDDDRRQNQDKPHRDDAEEDGQ